MEAEGDDFVDELDIGLVDDDNDTDLVVDESPNGLPVSSSVSRKHKSSTVNGQQPVFNVTVLARRDPAVQAIIESRKFAIIDNPYTLLAQSTLQASRSGQRLSGFESRAKLARNENTMKERLLSSQSNARFAATTSVPWANQDSDEITTIDYPRGKLTGKYRKRIFLIVKISF